jgi:NADH-quinone oxidoreductase subunit L
MGIGSWVGGLFHLITHAFFKALLFLGSGSVIHAAHHEQELPQYGGLIRKIPVTGITFFIAVLAIAGTGYRGVGLSGFYSKDMILAHAGAFSTLATHDGGSKWYWLFFILPAVIAYITAFYMMRCWTLTFWGKPRNQHLYDHAHESPVMWFPLVVLAFLSVIGGWRVMNVRDLLESSIKESVARCHQLQLDDKTGYYADKPFAGFRPAWPAELPKREEGVQAGGKPPAKEHQAGPLTGHEAFEAGESMVQNYVTWAFIVGIGAAFLIYLNGYTIAAQLVRIPPLGWIHKWLYHRMYFDELYFSVFVAITMGLSRLSAWFDHYVVDGIVNLVGWLVKQASVGIGLHDRYVVDGAVNGVGWLAQDLGAAVRAPQSGRIRMYVTVLMLAVVLGVAGAVIAVLSVTAR